MKFSPLHTRLSSFLRVHRVVGAETRFGLLNMLHTILCLLICKNIWRVLQPFIQQRCRLRDQELLIVQSVELQSLLSIPLSEHIPSPDGNLSSSILVLSQASLAYRRLRAIISFPTSMNLLQLPQSFMCASSGRRTMWPFGITVSP